MTPRDVMQQALDAIGSAYREHFVHTHGSTRNELQGAANAIRAELAKPAAVPDELTDKQVVSACFSYRHDYGLMDGKTRGHLEFQCREWWRAIRKELEHPSQHPMVLAARPQPPAPAVDVRELVEAAEAVVRRWDSPLWSQQGHTGEFIARLRAALTKHRGQS